jgi:ABC-type multidrug transport system ATPase subunit
VRDPPGAAPPCCCLRLLLRRRRHFSVPAALKLIKWGKSVFFSTHVMEVAEKLCDRIGIIKQGKLIFVGTMSELKEQHGKNGQSLEDIFLELIGSEVRHDI